MNIPRYWARATAQVTSPGGDRLDLSAYGWSAAGQADAGQRAQERLARLVERVRRNEPLPRGYGYGERPMREEIVLEHRDDHGEVTAVVTRNGYGALVLNAKHALFIDVDRAPAPGPGVLSRLFGRSRAPDAAETVPPALRDALAGSGGRFRVYRTAAGFRVLGTDRAWDPRAPATHDLMTRAGADPAFQALCRRQESFRARLTPKPWRCGQRLPPGTHPREHPDDRAAFARWLAGYDQATGALATCRFLATVGGDAVAPELQAVVAHHDETTRAGSTLPLA
jgi:hypothetical protein